MSKRNDSLYFTDILTSISSIEEYIRDLSFEAFCKDKRTVDAVIRNFEIIGEAANYLSDYAKSKYPQIPWFKIISMRNKMMHEYFGIDLEIIWKTIEEDLPELKKLVLEVEHKKF